MDRIRNFSFHSAIATPIAFGDKGSCPIDQQPAASFNIDPATGRPSDLMTSVMRAQGLERDKLLAGLQEYKSEFLPADMSDADAIKFAQPRLCQLPSELAEFQEGLIKMQIDEEKAAEMENERKKFLDMLDKEKETKVESKSE